MATFTPPIDMGAWYPGKEDLVTWVHEIWRYLSENPIVSESTIDAFITEYLDTHPIDAPVKSVNGKTGVINLTYGDVGAASETEMSEYKQATSSNTNAIGQINDVIPLLATKTALAATDANATQALSNAADAETLAQTADSKAMAAKNAADAAAVSAEAADQKAVEARTLASAAYSPSSPPPYPVTSVNGKSGNVTVFDVIELTLNFDGESLFYPYALDYNIYTNILSCNVINTSNANSVIVAINYERNHYGFYATVVGDYPSQITLLITVRR